jgi:hypothetical protein
LKLGNRLARVETELTRLQATRAGEQSSPRFEVMLKLLAMACKRKPVRAQLDIRASDVWRDGVASASDVSDEQMGRWWLRAQVGLRSWDKWVPRSMCFDAGFDPPRLSPRGSGWLYEFQCRHEHNLDAVSICFLSSPLLQNTRWPTSMQWKIRSKTAI